MRFDLDGRVTHEGALRALVRLPVGEQVLGQVVLPHEALIAMGTREVPRAVSRLVLPQRAVLAEALVAEGAFIRRLFGVRAMMGDQLGLVAEDAGAFATRPRVHMIRRMVGETLAVEKLFGANATSRLVVLLHSVVVVIVHGQDDQRIFDFQRLLLLLLGEQFDSVLALGPNRMAVMKLMPHQRRPMRVKFAATSALKRLLFAVLSMVRRQFGHVGKTFSALTTRK